MINTRHLAVALTAAIALTAAPSPASAATVKVQNSSASVYAINTYTDTSCTTGRYVLQPGRARTNPPRPRVRSVKVNAYSRHARIATAGGSGSYGPLIPPNRCVPTSGAVTLVKNYANS